MRSTRSDASSLIAPVLGAVPTLVLVAAQLVLSPTASRAPTPPHQKTAAAYATPHPPHEAAQPPAPVRPSWLVGDLDSGDLHAAENIDERHAPASTIKLLTALALVDVLDDRKKKIEAEYEDMEIDGTKVGLMQEIGRAHV